MNTDNMLDAAAELQDRYAGAPGFAAQYVGSRGFSLFPGGYGRSTFAMGPSTPMAVRGVGYHLWDSDDRRLIDLNNNFTSLIHGNAHPAITEAAVEALRRGASFGLPNEAEMAHARVLLSRIDAADQVRYTNSGTEAVMLAVRIARAATGRAKVVFLRNAYHGHSDLALNPGGPRSQRGVPEGVRADSLEVPINDVASLAEVFTSHGQQLAAVIVDPCPNRAGLVPVDSAYMKAAQELAASHGTLFVSDEVISLRQAFGGAAAAAGITPDLIVMGKLIGGGLPIGAVAGSASVMQELDPLSATGLEHGGTFSGNPVSMAAGLRSLDLFTTQEVDRLNTLGERLRQSLRPSVEARGWQVRGSGSLVRVYPIDESGAFKKEVADQLWWRAYDRGVLLTQSGMGALSTPMDDNVIDDVATRLVEAIEATSMRVGAL